MNSGEAFGAFMIICTGLVSLILYYLPTIVASHKEHYNTSAIFVINLLLGWTFIGWVIALAWAVTSTKGN